MASLAVWKDSVKQNLVLDPTFGQALSRERIESFCRGTGHVWRPSFWNPAVTVWTFLWQVLDGAKTLRAAVATLLVQLAVRGTAELPSPDPAAYCQARQRLPIEVILALLHHLTLRMRSLVTPATAWLGRRVWVVDGSSVSMPDTPALQKVFPQPPGQKPGCGFPVAQFVALFCWTTGAIVDVVIDALPPHEITLFRRLWHRFGPGDVVLGDRAYGSYVDLARLQQRGVFVVSRLHQRRSADFRRGKPLGHDDQLVVWPRPERWIPSFGITAEEFQQLPPTLMVRLVRIAQAPRGFRSRTIVVATTLLDPIEVPGDEIRALYRDRWTAELNLRSLKTHLGMDVLRGHSPDVVCKELAMHLLAYNLIRLLMWQAARQHGRDLHRLSFTGTLHRLRAAWSRLTLDRRTPDRHGQNLTGQLLAWIAADLVPNRPNRVEPRRRKRRPKEFSLLQQPRAYYHQH